MKISTGRIRHPHRTSLPVPHAEGTIPTAAEHSSTKRPAGPVSTSVRTVSRTRTALLRFLCLMRGAILQNIFPHAMVRWYPAMEPIAVDRSSMRKGSEAKPPMESPSTSPMASAVPDLPLPDTDSVINASTEVTVPIDATVEMKRSGLFSGKTAADIAAPTVEVIPGNHPARVPMSTPLSPGIGPVGSFTRSDWAGIRPSLDDSSITGMPNRPVSRGIMMLPSPTIPSDGIGSTMHPNPRIPDRRNAIGPHIPLPRDHSCHRSTALAVRRTAGVSLSRISPAPWIRSH